MAPVPAAPTRYSEASAALARRRLARIWWSATCGFFCRAALTWALGLVGLREEAQPQLFPIVARGRCQCEARESLCTRIPSLDLCRYQTTETAQ